MNNECPKCHNQAMDAPGKIMKRPFACRHCGQELRLNLVYTLILSLIYLFAVVRIFLANGISGQGMLLVLIATAVFVAACLFVPLEEKKTAS